MMKTYESATGKHYSFSVAVGEREHRVLVDPFFTTSDKDIQKAIESDDYYFNSGRLKTENKEVIVVELEKVTLEATNWQEAADVLKKEPYRIHHSKLKTPEAIKEQADLLGITFNL